MTFAGNECIECKHEVAQLSVSAPHATPSKVAELLVRLQHAQQHKKMFCELTDKIPGLCELSNQIQSRLSPGLEASTQAANDWELRWDQLLCQKYQAVEDDLRNSLRLYAVACQERCVCSLAEPKPHAKDVVAFLKTLDMCKQLEPVCATGEGRGFQPFTDQHNAVVKAIKNMFSELRDTCGRDIRADKMADAKAKLDKVNQMLVLRDVFANDSITLDAAVNDLRGDFDQKRSSFAQSICGDLHQERFARLNTRLLGYRNLTSAAEEEEYNDALSLVNEAGEEKYITAIEIINSISTEVRVELPLTSVKQLATVLKWIEGAKCLGEGDAPVLLCQVYERWVSAFQKTTGKLELLKERGLKLDEWKFKTVETMYRRLGMLSEQSFPMDIANTIITMRGELGKALEKKVAGLDDDMRKALREGDNLTIDLIFSEVKIAQDDDSNFVSTVQYQSLFKVLKDFIRAGVASIENHYAKFEMKEAQLKKKDLWDLAVSEVAEKHIKPLRGDLEAFAISRKKDMISRNWLKSGDVGKVDGFREYDRLQYDTLVNEFLHSFNNDIERLQKVETQNDVLKVGQVLLQLPQFAFILGSEKKDFFQQCWVGIWESLYRSVRLSLTVTASGLKHLDIRACISFLQAAKKLFHQWLNPVAPAEAQDPQYIFILPIPGTDVQKLMLGLDSLLGHLDVNASEIEAGWCRHIEEFDCTKEGQSFGNTLRFIRQLKRQEIAIKACGEYGIQKTLPTAELAVNKLCATASSRIAVLNSLKPEDGVAVWYNLDLFCNDCTKIIDDDTELQGVLLNKMLKPKSDAEKWVAQMERDIIKKSDEFYGNARKLDGRDQRKNCLREVTNCLESHERLQKKLVTLGLRLDTGAELPLIAQLKTKISKETEETIERLSVSVDCSVDQIADSIHGTYITATDLVNLTIQTHAESCIGEILDAVEKHTKKNKFGLQMLGTVLERDHDQGGQIVLIMPQFNDMNLQAFQEMTGKTPHSTVDEVSKLNNLDDAQKLKLLQVVNQVFTKYDAIMRKSKVGSDLDRIVADVKKHYANSSDLSDAIGGVFAIWSLQSITVQCRTPRKPLSTQIVAIVRLLNLDKPPETLKNKVFSAFPSWLKSKKLDKKINASHLAQIKTGQGKSVVLGVLATVLSMLGFK